MTDQQVIAIMAAILYAAPDGFGTKEQIAADAKKLFQVTKKIAADVAQEPEEVNP